MKSYKILFLAPLDNIPERIGLIKALESKADLFFLDKFYSTFQEILDFLKSKNFTPDLILHPDVHFPYIPENIEDSPYPTACLHIDTYSDAKGRMNRSLLYDLVFIFHPQYTKPFTNFGNPCVVFTPHAVDGRFFKYFPQEKSIDVAMVGRMDGRDYSYRRDCLAAIKQLNIKCNDFDQYYNYQEMIALYKDAKIGLNISRNSYLEDANLRCFEVMASGALLFTPHLSELEKIDFIAGQDYVTFENERDLKMKINFYLNNPEKLKHIALNGQEKTLKLHTYENRANLIIELIQNGIKLQAPGRKKPKGEVASIFVQYFSKVGHVNKTFFFLKKQITNSGGNLLTSLLLSLKVTIRSLLRLFSR